MAKDERPRPPWLLHSPSSRPHTSSPPHQAETKTQAQTLTPHLHFRQALSTHLQPPFSAPSPLRRPMGPQQLLWPRHQACPRRPVRRLLYDGRDLNSFGRRAVAAGRACIGRNFRASSGREGLLCCWSFEEGWQARDLPIGVVWWIHPRTSFKRMSPHSQLRPSGGSGRVDRDSWRWVSWLFCSILFLIEFGNCCMNWWCREVIIIQIASFLIEFCKLLYGLMV